MFLIYQSMYEIEILNDKNEYVMTDVHVSRHLASWNVENFYQNIF